MTELEIDRNFYVLAAYISDKSSCQIYTQIYIYVKRIKSSSLQNKIP